MPLQAVRRASCGAILLLAGSMPLAGASAAQPRSLPQPLTLDAAIAQALDHNPEIRTARANVDVRAGEAEHAGRLVPSNPRLELEAAERDAPDDTTTDIGVRLSQELFTASKGDLAARAARARTAGTRAQLDFLRTAVTARTRRAFLELLAARESVKTAERVLEAVREIERYASRRLEAGEATRLEVNSASIGVGRAKAALARAQAERSRARLALAELLAVDPAQELRVTGNLQPAELQLPERERLLRRALERRDDLAAAAREVKAAREELRLSRRQLIPNLTVFGFYKEEEGAQVAGGGVSIPLPVLHRYGGEQRAAAARLERAQIAQDALRLTVRRQVLEAVAEYRSARERVQALSQRMLEAAQENVALTRTAFSAGQVGAPAITTAQENLLSVRREYLDALRALIESGTALERSTGGLITLAQGTEKSESSSQERNQ